MNTARVPFLNKELSRVKAKLKVFFPKSTYEYVT